MARTGGTTLNGDLACRFERVCGHKGNSYDMARFMARASAQSSYIDTFGKLYHGFHRGRVPFKVLDEIGYEDCDYISNEVGWNWWMRFAKWYLPVELHVPCRDPVDHLMSQCNYKRLKFDCTKPIEPQVRQCEVQFGRFGGGLTSRFNVKCYRYEKQFSEYMEYMSHRLQKRRKQVTYTLPANKKPRSPSDECIFSQEHAGLKQRLEEHLLSRFEYYRFCKRCIGSENDLLS